MNKALQIGDFSIFGFSKNPGIFLQQHVPARLGVTPRSLNFGSTGSFFFHSTYGDIAEGEEALVLKLGFLRSPDMSTLCAKQLLGQRIVNPNAIEYERILGNALVVCLGKKECSFSAFKTLLSVPQLYYVKVDDGVICSDRLKCIVQLLDNPELDEDLIPMHFLFRSTPGDLTYFRQIRRLLPGECLYWTDGEISLKLVQDFHFTNYPAIAYQGEENIIESLYERLQSVVKSYVALVEQNGESLATLLSGGVDSCLLQHLINKETTRLPSHSYSFAVRAPSFSNEIEYARQASQLFETEHTFVDIQPEDYPGLITRAIEALAQPPILETEPSMLSVAEYASKRELPERYFVSGQGADTVFGLNWSKKLKALHVASQIPGSVWILKATGSILKPFSSLSQMALKAGDILSSSKNPDSFLSPTNSIVVYADPGLLRRCFGDDTLIKAFRYRREFAAKYLDTDHYLENIHIVDLLTDTYELGVQRQQLFLAHKREKIHPFFDDDILRAGFAIPAEKRYIKRMRPKYLLKDILQRKTGAAVAHKPKGFSVWETDLLDWMKTGSLRPLVREIKLPDFLTRSDYDKLQEAPSYFLWELLIFDLFQQSLQFVC